MRKVIEQLTKRRPFLPFRIHMTARHVVEKGTEPDNV